MGLYDFTFYDLIRRNAAVFGSAPAWHESDDGETLTFDDIKNRVTVLAAGLQAAGVKNGDRLGVLGKNSLAYFLLYGAAAALGAIMLPVNWRLSGDEVAYILNDGTPEWLFVDAEFQDMICSRQPELASVRRYYNLRSDEGGMERFSSLFEGGALESPPAVESDAGFVIIHTAAVAGRPRGALLSHANMLCACLHLDYYLRLGQKDVHLSLLPLFHVAGLFMAVAAFQAGAMNVNVSRFDAGAAVDLIQNHKVSLLFDFPPILSSLLAAAAEKTDRMATLRAVMGLGTAEDIQKYQEITGGTYWCMFGQTETSLLCTLGRYRDAPGSAGKPVLLADVQTVNDDGTPAAAGQPGEIVMRGPMVFKGYWNLPEDTAYTFRNGCHHTGDMGRFDENGVLFYAGRKPEKELIKPGGENVYPAEVETVILTHPAVEKTVVIGVPDPKWKEGIKAVCQLKPGMTLEAAELIAFVGERIARYKKPHYVEIVSELPLATDGMPDREKIKALYGKA